MTSHTCRHCAVRIFLHPYTLEKAVYYKQLLFILYWKQSSHKTFINIDIQCGAGTLFPSQHFNSFSLQDVGILFFIICELLYFLGKYGGVAFYCLFHGLEFRVSSFLEGFPLNVRVLFNPLFRKEEKGSCLSQVHLCKNEHHKLAWKLNSFSANVLHTKPIFMQLHR